MPPDGATPPQPPHEPGPGDRLGPYLLQQALGRGATGNVFRAVDSRSGATIALKLLHQLLSASDEYVGRFDREARIARQVSHPHLVPVLDAGEVAGRHYLASAFVDGRSLREALQGTGGLPLDDALRVVSEIASALDALHAGAVVHRDVKPANVLLDGTGRALLTDFGLAKGPAYTVLTRPGQILGTPLYLAPELIRGEPASPSSDLYALGCLAFACLTGGPPFRGTNLLELTVAHLEAEPPDVRRARPELSMALAAAVTGALAKDPARRPGSARSYALSLVRAATA